MSARKAKKYIEYAAEGNLEGLKDVFDGKDDVNIRDTKGRTPLFAASGSGQLEVMQELLKHGAKVNSKDCKRWTPLHNAARFGQTTSAEILLTAGADINRSNIRLATPLMLSCRHGHLSMTILLVRHKCDVNSTDMHGRHALHWAVKGGELDIVKLLLENGADANMEDDWVKTPLIQAAKSNRPAVVQHLLSLKVDCSIADLNGRTALHVAAEKNCSSALQALIGYGIPPDTPLLNGGTPIMDAAFNCQLAAVKVLVEGGADVNLVDNDRSLSLHHLVFARVTNQQPRPWFDLALFLLRANVDVSAQTEFGIFSFYKEEHHPQNVLELALKGGLAQFVKLFAMSGCDLGNIKLYLKLKTKELTMFVAKNTRLLDWIRRFFKSPRPLRDLARTAFRRAMPSVHFLKALSMLELAPGLKNSILFSELEGLREAPAVNLEEEYPEKTADGLSDSEVDYEPSIYDSDEHIDRDIIDSD